MNLIDIRMVGTQILGFLLLLWGLRKWAWGPLTAQLEARRQRIADEFSEAERRQNPSPGRRGLRRRRRGDARAARDHATHHQASDPAA